MAKRTYRTLVLLGLVLTFLAPAVAKSDDVYTVIVKKQEEKKKTRWSLAEWLETRDRMRMMDLWLALHSPSPYEFYIGGDYNMADNDVRGRYKSGRIYGAAYASIFGLELQKGFAPDNELLGIFHLRIFGFHAQATNLTLEGGLRSEKEPYDTRNAFAGASMSIYLGKFFGLEGLYRHHFAGVPNTSGLSVSGNQYSGGAFIDFSFFRLYGDYYSAPATVKTNAGSAEVQQTGVVVGTKLFF